MRINPIILAQTRLLVPNTLPIKRDAASSAASVVMPEMKTVKRRYFFMYIPIKDRKIIAYFKSRTYCHAHFGWVINPTYVILYSIKGEMNVYSETISRRRSPKNSGIHQSE